MRSNYDLNSCFGRRKGWWCSFCCHSTALLVENRTWEHSKLDYNFLVYKFSPVVVVFLAQPCQGLQRLFKHVHLGGVVPVLKIHAVLFRRHFFLDPVDRYFGCRFLVGPLASVCVAVICVVQFSFGRLYWKGKWWNENISHIQRNMVPDETEWWWR